MEEKEIQEMKSYIGKLRELERAIGQIAINNGLEKEEFIEKIIKIIRDKINETSDKLPEPTQKELDDYLQKIIKN